VQMGMIAWQLSGDGLHTEAVKAMTQQHITTLFDIDVHEAVDSGVPGITMSKPVRFHIVK
jgi:hypothetical protein